MAGNCTGAATGSECTESDQCAPGFVCHSVSASSGLVCAEPLTPPAVTTPPWDFAILEMLIEPKEIFDNSLLTVRVAVANVGGTAINRVRLTVEFPAAINDRKVALFPSQTLDLPLAEPGVRYSLTAQLQNSPAGEYVLTAVLSAAGPVPAEGNLTNNRANARFVIKPAVLR